MKRIAVVGVGGMGRFHAETINNMPDVELAALADPFPSAAAESFGLPVSTDVLGVASEGWDGVIVASTDESHAELTLAALEAGSRVLCEKPLAHDLQSAVSVIEAETSLERRMVQVGFMRRYDKRHLDLTAQMESIGELRFLRCANRNTNADPRPARIVMNQSLIHDFHTVNWLAGPVQSVSAVAVPRPGGLDHVHVTCRMASGAVSIIEFHDRNYAYDCEVEATGPHGMVRSESPYLPMTRRITDEMPAGDDWFSWFADAYRTQDWAWVQSLHAPEAMGPSSWDGLEAQLIAEAAITSLVEHGAAIELPEPGLSMPAIYR